MKYLLISLVLLSSFGNITAQKIRIAEPVHFLALGDSYTIGQSVSPDQSWPLQFASALAYSGYDVEETKIIAQTGWRTDNLANAISNQQPLTGYKLVSLLIGVNNQYQGRSLENYAVEFEELLQTAIALAGNSKDHVFVLSIPDYAYTPYGNGNSAISTQIDLFNSVNRQITQEYGVTYINITPISRNGLSNPELVASDGLHPSGIMYGLWVQEIMKNIENELALEEQSTAEEPVEFTIMHRVVSVKSTGKESDFWIYSATGAPVKQVRLSSNGQTSIDLAGLPAGIYFIQIRTNSKAIFTKKIVLV